MTRNKQTPAVTEFNITFFGMDPETATNLLSKYADEAYELARDLGLETPCLGSREFSTFEQWEKS